MRKGKARGPVLRGRELHPEDLELIRAQVESFDTVQSVDDEMYAFVAAQWPHLLAKIKPRSPRRPK